MKRLVIGLLISLFMFCASTPVMAAQDLDKQRIKLENKIAKKFSNTFCNSTGFGISDEGALKFSLGETKSEFSKKPLVEKVDIKNVKEQILVNIADTCYYFDLAITDLDSLSLEYQKK